MPPAAALLRGRNLPDAEKSQNVIDTEGVEIAGHVPKASFPPVVTVFRHGFPIIGREAPVLTVGRKEIRRGTGVAVEIEELWAANGIHAVPSYPYGKVSF